MKILSTLVFTLLALISHAQKINLKPATEKLKAGHIPVAADFGFREYRIYDKSDTIVFFTHQRPGSNPNSVFLTLPGSDAEDIYTFHKENDSSFWFNSLTDFDFSYLPKDFLLVIIAKPGFGFCGKSKPTEIPAKYWKFTSLEDRVYRADKAIGYVTKNVLRNPRKTVVFGYSEGFYVAAKLALSNKQVTHVGIGGGGGLTDFYDFIIMNQKSVLLKESLQDSAVADNNAMIYQLHDIIKNPSDTVFTYGYSNKRWASFAEPPVYSLLKLTIPLYQVHAANDNSTPLETAYIIPVEFARLRKDNLTFTVIPNCDHSFNETTASGNVINHKSEVMTGFFKWVDSH